jgi:hypothetical protein
VVAEVSAALQTWKKEDNIGKIRDLPGLERGRVAITFLIPMRSSLGQEEIPRLDHRMIGIGNRMIDTGRLMIVTVEMEVEGMTVVNVGIAEMNGEAMETVAVAMIVEDLEIEMEGDIDLGVIAGIGTEGVVGGMIGIVIEAGVLGGGGSGVEQTWWNWGGGKTEGREGKRFLKL